MSMLRNLFGLKPRQHSLPEGRRIYAIGDIHGRADLLDELLDAIGRDDKDRGDAESELIFLGDLVDRGPDSAAVVKRVRELCEHGIARMLKGNHEEVFVGAAEGDSRRARLLIAIGGLPTLMSYGISEEEANRGNFQDLADLIQARIPADDIRFLRKGEESVVIGDYMFVHAGIRPGIGIEAQKASDLRWIREPFLSSRADHGFMVVHGHTPAAEVEELPNRIGLDTGAFFTGRLSALGIEQGERWVVSVQGSTAELVSYADAKASNANGLAI